MKKYILKSGKEVKFGDIIYARNVTGYPSIMLVTLDEDSVDTLKELGIIREVKLKDDSDIATGKDIPTNTEDTKPSAGYKGTNCETDIDEFLKRINSELKRDYIKDIVEYVANKLGVTFIEAIKYLDDLKIISPAALLNVSLKRIAYRLNKGYDKKPIRDLDKIYIISMYNGKIDSICPKYIKNLNHFAWFRSAYDAEFARNCVIDLIETMFGKDDQPKD